MDPDSLSIEPARPRHLSEILAIEKVSFRNPFTENLFQTELQLALAHLHVVLWEGKVVGYLDFWHVGPEMHLINIAVDPKCRRQGVAGKMMDLMLDYATQHKVEEILLDVRVSNRGAIELYKKYKFEEVGTRKKYYSDNDEDALMMKITPPH